MDIRAVQNANRIVEEIRKLDHLESELRERDIDFIQNGHVRSIGRNQLGESQINGLKGDLKAAVANWFDESRAALRHELQELGVEMMDTP